MPRPLRPGGGPAPDSMPALAEATDEDLVAELHRRYDASIYLGIRFGEDTETVASLPSGSGHTLLGLLEAARVKIRRELVGEYFGGDADGDDEP